MSLFFTLRKNLTSLPIYLHPDHDLLPDSSPPSIIYHELQPDDYILCHERDGIWFHFHTRNISGWTLASNLQPLSFPCAFIINDELPSEAQIRLRTKPSDDQATVGSIVYPGTIIDVIEMKDKWLRINYQGKEAWLKREVNEEDVILAVPVIPKLYEKGPTVPPGCSLRLRDSPKDDGNVTRLSQSDYFLGVQCQGNYIQVIAHPRQPFSSGGALPSAEWILRKTADGVILLQESKKRVEYMCLQKEIPQDAVLRIRNTPESDGEEVGDLTYWDVFPVWFKDGVWAYTLTDLWEGFVLTASGKSQFLQKFQATYPTIAPPPMKSDKKSVAAPTSTPAPASAPLPEENLTQSLKGTQGRETQKTNPFDEQPLPSQASAAKPKNSFDEQPLPSTQTSGKSRVEDERPLSGMKSNPSTNLNSFDEQPLPSQATTKPNPFDEQPLPSTQSSAKPQIEDERPISGMKASPNSFDEQPLPSQATTKPNPFDEQPLPSHTSSKPQFEDERPLSGMKSNPSANLNSFDEQPLPSQAATKPNPFDEQPLPSTQSSAKPQIEDERPISGTKVNSFDEQPLASSQTSAEGQSPLPSASNDDSLLNAPTGPPDFSKKPALGKTKKGPPARLLANKKITTPDNADLQSNNENVPNGNIEKPLPSSSSATTDRPKKLVEAFQPHQEEPTLPSPAATVEEAPPVVPFDEQEDRMIMPSSGGPTLDPYGPASEDERPFGKILDLMNSYTPENQIEGLRLFVGTISTMVKGVGGSNVESAHEVFQSLVHGLCSCLQEPNPSVKEEAVKSLTDLQEMNSNVRHGIISLDSAVTLATTLTSKLFTNKFTDDLLSKQIPAVSRTLLEAYPTETIPCFANGLVSKNLHCVLNIVNLFHESVLGGHLTEAEGKGIADGEQNTELKILIHNLLIVISTSKPKMKSIALKTLQKMAKIWPLDLSSVLSGEFEEEIDSTLLQVPQVQEILHSIAATPATAAAEPQESKRISVPAVPVAVAAVTNSPPIRGTKFSSSSRGGEGEGTFVEEETVVPKAMKLLPGTPSPASSPRNQTPLTPQRPLSTASPQLSPRERPQPQAQQRQQSSLSAELESVDESLFELLLSSLPIEDQDHDETLSHLLSPVASATAPSSFPSPRIELLGGCQEDFDAIDEELLRCAMQKQQQEEEQQRRRRDYAEMMPDPMASEEELSQLFQKEFEEFFKQSDFEARRQDLFLHRSGSPSLDSSPSPGDDSVKLLKIDSFDSETLPFL